MSSQEQNYRYRDGTHDRHLRWIEAGATIGTILKSTQKRSMQANEDHLACLVSKLDHEQRAAFDEALKQYTTP